MVFQIDFKGKKGLFYMSDEYTAYPGEGEVLLQDGLQYRVTAISKRIYRRDTEEIGDTSYYLICL